MPFMEIRLFSMEGFPLKQAKNKKELYVVNENYSIFFVFCLSNRARQNRTFAKRYLERGDCLSRSRAEHGKGEFLRLRFVRYEIKFAAKRGETAAQASNLAEQRSGSAM